MATFQSNNPYVGPRPFEYEDKALFFGREREINDLKSLLTAHRTVLLYAASGAGKTSLLKAGLQPKMEEKGFKVFPVARVSGPTPRSVYTNKISNFYIFNTLMNLAKDKKDKDESDYKSMARMSLAEYLKTRKSTRDSDGFSAPRLIIFDQFEEMFTLYQQHWKQREGFFKQVAEALEDDPKNPDSVLRVLFVLREDYLARLDPYVSYLQDRMRARYRLVRLRFEDACQAVKSPLIDSGRSFARGTAELLVEELLKTKAQSVTGKIVKVVGEYVEPVQLQIVCRNLWNSLPEDITLIKPKHLQEFADVDEALTGFYEKAIQKTISEATVTEKELRNWFDQFLITPAGTRGTAYRGKGDTAGIPNTAVDILENEHILLGEARAGAHWYELTHDRLIEPIQKSNATWLSEQTKKTILGLRTSKYLGMEFVLIPAGIFVMGSSTGNDNENPPHSVKISQPFYFQTTEVTQGQWKKVMEYNPSEFHQDEDDYPVENVSWDEVQRFIQKLNQSEETNIYRLPSEAEWEYACRAGTTTEYSFGDDASKLGKYAWYHGNSEESTKRVATKKPNSFGLYDLYGSVWEWVEDDWHDNYDGAPNRGIAWVDNPRACYRVQRGGSWSSDAQDCRSAMRLGDRPSDHSRRVGFRLVRSITLNPLVAKKSKKNLRKPVK